MHAEALTRGNLSHRPVLPFRTRLRRGARREGAREKNPTTVIGTNINKAIGNPPFYLAPGSLHTRGQM